MALGNVHQESTALARLQRRDARPRVDRRVLAKARAGMPVYRARAPFACVQVCMSCGRLREPSGGDPMREAADAPLGPCSCGASAWADLGDEDVARNLAEVESFELRDLAPRRRTGRVLMWLATALTLGVTVVLALAGAKTYAPLFSLLTALFAILVVPGYLIDIVRELQRRRRKLPWRWTLALAPTVAEDGPPIAMGSAGVLTDPIFAPLSGRACIGYEVRIARRNAPASSAPALVEQRCVDFVVDGRTVPGARALLRISTHELSTTALAGREEIVAHYLRRHGLLAEDGPWILCEAVLEPEMRVTVARANGGGAVVRT